MIKNFKKKDFKRIMEYWNDQPCLFQTIQFIISIFVYMQLNVKTSIFLKINLA